MNRPYRHFRQVLALFLAFQTINTHAAPRRAKTDAVVVTTGRPNVFTLEQAHYLLERNRRRNGKIEARDPGDLDANEPNAVRLSLIRTLLAIAGEFDQAAGIKNRESLRQYSENTAPRFATLTERQDAARREVTDVNARLAVAEKRKAELAQQGVKADDPLMVAASGEIAQLKSQQASLNAEIASLNESIKNLSTGPQINGVAPAGNPAADREFKDMLSKDLLTDMLKDLGAVQPKLSAGIRLDNYIQMQQELIAKQLTLLRDEAGPDSKVIFLELPQSVHAAKNRGQEQLAQTWWRLGNLYQVKGLDHDMEANIDSLTMEEIKLLSAGQHNQQALYLERLSRMPQLAGISPDAATSYHAFETERRELQRSLDHLQDRRSRLRGYLSLLDNCPSASSARAFEDIRSRVQNTPDSSLASSADCRQMKQAMETLLSQLDKTSAEVESKLLTLANRVDKHIQDALRKYTTALDSARECFYAAASAGNTEREKACRTDYDRIVPIVKTIEDAANYRQYEVNLIPPNHRDSARTIDLIPKQSTINIAGANGKINNQVFAGVLKTLTFGLSGRYEKSKELLEQFTYQEAFAWGFGKGQQSFGWTFEPMAFGKELPPGVRTTYAVLAVPANTNAIELKSRGCWMGLEGAMLPAFPQNGKPVSKTRPGLQHFRDAGSDLVCAEPRTVTLRIPGQLEGFHLEGLRYSQAKPGERTVINLRGKNFSPQMQILVDGFPLERVLSSAEFSKTPSTNDEVYGFFEWVSSREAVLSFSMGSSYSGTPTIVIAAPGKTEQINFTKNVAVNNLARTSLHRHSKTFPMFLSKPDLTLSRAQPKSLDKARQEVELYLVGTGFHPTADFSENGNKANATVQSSNLAALKFPRPDKSALWTFDVRSNLHPGAAATVTVEDPYPPLIASCKVWNAYTSAGLRMLELQLTGKFFNGKQKLELKPGDKFATTLRVDGRTTAYLAILEKSPSDRIAAILPMLSLNAAGGGETYSWELDKLCTAILDSVREKDPVDVKEGTIVPNSSK